jgi:hypothetical protein
MEGARGPGLPPRRARLRRGGQGRRRGRERVALRPLRRGRGRSRRRPARGGGARRPRALDQRARQLHVPRRRGERPDGCRAPLARARRRRRLLLRLAAGPRLRDVRRGPLRPRAGGDGGRRVRPRPPRGRAARRGGAGPRAGAPRPARGPAPARARRDGTARLRGPPAAADGASLRRFGPCAGRPADRPPRRVPALPGREAPGSAADGGRGGDRGVPHLLHRLPAGGAPDAAAAAVLLRAVVPAVPAEADGPRPSGPARGPRSRPLVGFSPRGTRRTRSAPRSAAP